MSRIIICILTLAITTGCSSIRKLTMPDDENLLSGAGSIVKETTADSKNSSTESFEEINLDKLLKKYGLENPSVVAAKQEDSSGEYKYRRNDLQERIISASNQRCSTYIRTLISSKSQTQTAWTSLSLLLSGAASVTGPAATAKALAAGSTVSTGVLSTYNEAYFNNLTVNVIISGISKQRESILEKISKYQTKSLGLYSVNAAISDAITYHAACNVVIGMETAAQATNNADNADISTLSR